MPDFSLRRLCALMAESHPRIVWRHDVDYVPECALKMARLENLFGINATYYFLPRSDDYNIFSPSTSRIVHAIWNLGHTIGTHVDLHLPRDGKIGDRELGRRIANDHRLLASVFPMSRRVSFHQPPRSVMWRHVQGGFESAADPSWQGRYVADSRGVFRHSPEEAIASGVSVQIGLHPEWWFLPEAAAEALREQEAVKP